MLSNNTGSPPPLLDPGPTKEELTSLPLQPMDDYMISTPSEVSLEILTQPPEINTSMPESVQPNKKKTSKDKLTNSKKRTMSTKSSNTLDRESISNDKDCEPYWNDCTKEWSRRLLSCTGTDLPDSPMIYWNSSSNKKDADSWFTVKAKALNQPNNLPKTSWPLPRSLWQLITAREQQKTESAENQAMKKRKKDRSRAKKEHEPKRTKKIRIYPNSEEKVILNDWFGLARRAYNTAAAIDQQVKKRNKKTIQSIRMMMEEEDRTGKPRSWTNAFRNYINSQEKDADFVDKCPQNIRGHAVDQFLKAKRSTKAAETEASLKNTKRKKAQFQFRSKKHDFQQSIVFDARDWEKPTGKVYSFFSKMKTKKEKLPPLGKLEAEVKVTLNKAGEYYFCLSMNLEKVTMDTGDEYYFRSKKMHFEGERKKIVSPPKNHSTAALDPGVRTFQTVYDADGQGFEWGKDDMKTVFYLCRQADKLQSKISERKTRRRGQAYHRILSRIKNQVRDCHNKLALFLCENYRAILIPEFDTKRMIKRRDRKLHKKTVRGMCTWSHYTFRQILLQKAELFPWVKVAIVNEAYTSKTCGHCGHIHQRLGGNKTFVCPSCGNRADRDLHAARNILLRYLTREIGVAQDVFLNTSCSH